MEKYYGIGAILGICLFILFIGIMKQKAKVAAAFFSRGIVGTAAILGANAVLKSQGIAVAVGVNPLSVLTVASLGISGFVLLYGILFYRFL